MQILGYTTVGTGKASVLTHRAAELVRHRAETVLLFVGGELEGIDGGVRTGRKPLQA